MASSTNDVVVIDDDENGIDPLLASPPDATSLYNGGTSKPTAFHAKTDRFLSKEWKSGSNMVRGKRNEIPSLLRSKHMKQKAPSKYRRNFDNKRKRILPPSGYRPEEFQQYRESLRMALDSARKPMLSTSLNRSTTSVNFARMAQTVRLKPNSSTAPSATVPRMRPRKQVAVVTASPFVIASTPMGNARSKRGDNSIFELSPVDKGASYAHTSSSPPSIASHLVSSEQRLARTMLSSRAMPPARLLPTEIHNATKTGTPDRRGGQLPMARGTSPGIGFVSPKATSSTASGKDSAHKIMQKLDMVSPVRFPDLDASVTVIEDDDDSPMFRGASMPGLGVMAQLKEMFPRTQKLVARRYQEALDIKKHVWDVNDKVTRDAIAVCEEKDVELTAHRDRREANQAGDGDTIIVLSDDEVSRVEDIWNRNNDADELISTVGNDQIHRYDLQTLEGNSWLNDKIINAYITLVVQRSTANTNLPTVWAHTSFFYPKLKSMGYPGVRRWTKKSKCPRGFFGYDKVVIPLNLGNMHWCCGIIDFRRKRLEVYDSMDISEMDFFDVMRDYMQQESQEKLGKDFDFDGWEDFAAHNCPKQGNGCDCGVFAVQFASYRARDLPLTFTQRDMHHFRQRICWEIANNACIG
eukprot:m.1334862 g.1334862  ORF g.1334862 m.1334862 type:complete len:637 (-) comp24877_c0_seq4:2180-4090(-)